MNEERVTLSEAAQILGVHRNTIRNWVMAGKLTTGENVTITGFGTFKVSNRAARMGVNPRNPTERISIPAMRVPSFKAGKTLKDAVR